jgi:hypothetical protein
VALLPGRSTSGRWSAVKSVASCRHFCLPAARCSLGLCQSRVCFTTWQSMPARASLTPKRLAPVHRSALCVRAMPLSLPRAEARRAGEPVRAAGGVHPDQPPSRDLPAASRTETADPTALPPEGVTIPRDRPEAPRPVAFPWWCGHVAILSVLLTTCRPWPSEDGFGTRAAIRRPRLAPAWIRRPSQPACRAVALHHSGSVTAEAVLEPERPSYARPKHER